MQLCSFLYSVKWTRAYCQGDGAYFLFNDYFQQRTRRTRGLSLCSLLWYILNNKNKDDYEQYY
jgi:hypothetical protein